MSASDPPLSAPRYGLLLGQTVCHYCCALTPTAAVWVASFEDVEDGEVIDAGGPALLRYVEWLDKDSDAFVAKWAPWLRLASTRTSGQTYYAHHCTTCGALQGDHFVFSPDGPYWPQDDAALGHLHFLGGAGSLMAKASASQSHWMEKVEDGCRQA